jgi:hypothetical protein
MFDASGRNLGKMGEGRVGTYRIAKPIVDADLVIDFAKAKVHCSAGATLSLKNYVGIVPSALDLKGVNRLKDIPHYSDADKAGGSQYVLNHTIGNTSADLHAAAAYAAKDGSLQRTKQRKLLCIIDGVVSGEKTQFNPNPVPTGWIGAAYDPVALDHVGVRCMGFDPMAMPSLKPSRTGTLAIGRSDAAGVRVVFDGAGSFTDYFSSKRALKPELVVADWGDSISLSKMSLPAPTVQRDGSRVVVRTAAAGATVRLESGDSFLALSRASDGTFAGEVAASQLANLRVVVADSHFNTRQQLAHA